MKLSVLYYSVGDKDVWELQQMRRDLDPRELEDRVLTDMFMWCFERMEKCDVVDAIKANSREDLHRMAEVLARPSGLDYHKGRGRTAGSSTFL